MPHDAYPTAADIASYLAAFGVEVPAGAPLDTFAAAGVARFEREAGRKMLAEAEEAWTFDPPVEPLLHLGGDLAALTQVTYQPQGASAEVFTAPDDYRLLPQNAALQGRPWEFLEFRPRWGAPQPRSLGGALSVLGRWGYGLTIPDDAWLAMLAAGAAPLWDMGAAAMMGGTGGPVIEWREGNSAAKYGAVSTEQLAAMKEQFLIDFPAAVASYRKVYL